MAELLVVRSKIKDCTKCNVAGDFADALSKKVEAMIKDAEKFVLDIKVHINKLNISDIDEIRKEYNSL